MAAEQGVSFAPDAFLKGGGLIDDVDATIETARFATYDYDGKIQNPVLALHVILKVDGEEEAHDQWYSAGDLAHFVPSNDGCRVIPTGSKTGLSDGSNLFVFLTSLGNAGYDMNKLADGDISVLDGLRAHWVRIPQPKRSGLPSQAAGPGGQQREKTILTVQKVLGEAKGKGKVAAGKTTAGKAAPAKAPAPATNGDNDLDETLQGLVMEIIAEAGGSIAKKDLAGKVFKAAPKTSSPKEKAAMSKRAFDDEFLSAGPWEYDGATLTM